MCWNARISLQFEIVFDAHSAHFRTKPQICARMFARTRTSPFRGCAKCAGVPPVYGHQQYSPQANASFAPTRSSEARSKAIRFALSLLPLLIPIW